MDLMRHVEVLGAVRAVLRLPRPDVVEIVAESVPRVSALLFYRTELKEALILDEGDLEFLDQARNKYRIDSFPLGMCVLNDLE